MMTVLLRWHSGMKCNPFVLSWGIGVLASIAFGSSS